jgi:hypothetical protein
MNLYIETENGVTKNHPAFEDNLLETFGSIPEHWEPFTRVERPVLGEHEVMILESPTYEKVNGVWLDVWHKRDMTAEEIAVKQENSIEKIKTKWAARDQAENFAAWTFDEATLTYVPPIPRPETGDYFWQGTTSSWVAKPTRPDDGKQYKMDFTAGVWVEFTL